MSTVRVKIEDPADPRFEPWIVSAWAEPGESDIQTCKRLQRLARGLCHTTIYTPATEEEYRAYRAKVKATIEAQGAQS